jgi:hypothetical protein
MNFGLPEYEEDMLVTMTGGVLLTEKDSGESGCACLKLLLPYSYEFSDDSLKNSIRIFQRLRRESKRVGYLQAHCR